MEVNNITIFLALAVLLTLTLSACSTMNLAGSAFERTTAPTENPVDFSSYDGMYSSDLINNYAGLYANYQELIASIDKTFDSSAYQKLLDNLNELRKQEISDSKEELNILLLNLSLYLNQSTSDSNDSNETSPNSYVISQKEFEVFVEDVTNLQNEFNKYKYASGEANKEYFEDEYSSYEDQLCLLLNTLYVEKTSSFVVNDSSSQKSKTSSFSSDTKDSKDANNINTLLQSAYEVILKPSFPPLSDLIEKVEFFVEQTPLADSYFNAKQYSFALQTYESLLEKESNFVYTQVKIVVTQNFLNENQDCVTSGDILVDGFSCCEGLISHPFFERNNVVNRCVSFDNDCYPENALFLLNDDNSETLYRLPTSCCSGLNNQTIPSSGNVLTQDATIDVCLPTVEEDVDEELDEELEEEPYICPQEGLVCDSSDLVTDCFIDAINNDCSPAMIISNIDFNVFGTLYNISLNRTFIGSTKSVPTKYSITTLVNYYIINFSDAYMESISEEELEEITSLIDAINRANITCHYELNDLKDFLVNEKDNNDLSFFNFQSDLYGNNYGCSGSLYDLVYQINQEEDEESVDGSEEEVVTQDEPASTSSSSSYSDYVFPNPQDTKAPTPIPGLLSGSYELNEGESCLSVSLGFLNAQEGVIIRYTTDGSNPTQSSSVYTQPLCFAEGTTVLKYRAYVSGKDPSDVAQRTYSVSKKITYQPPVTQQPSVVSEPAPVVPPQHFEPVDESSGLPRFLLPLIAVLLLSGIIGLIIVRAKHMSLAQEQHDEEVKNYITSLRKKGYSDEIISKTLTDRNYSPKHVDKLLNK
jgi:hypothetical protein